MTVIKINEKVKRYLKHKREGGKEGKKDGRKARGDESTEGEGKGEKEKEYCIHKIMCLN